MQKATFCDYYFKSFLADIYNPCRKQLTYHYIAFQCSRNTSNKSIEYCTSYFKSRESSIYEQTNRKHITT